MTAGPQVAKNHAMDSVVIPLPGSPAVLARDPGPGRIGHNGGPPLEMPPHGGWTGKCWHKAYAAAWRTPPIEVVRRRCRRAAGLGLSYRQYTSVILDRGVAPQAIVVTADAVTADDGVTVRPVAVDRLARLGYGRRFVVAEDRALAADLAPACRAEPVVAPAAALAPALVAALVGHGLTPSMAVLVGAGAADDALARTLNPGLILTAANYFV